MKISFVLALSVCCLSLCPQVKAQLKAGTEGVFIKNGTPFSVDGLAMVPSEDLALNNISIIKESLPVYWPQYSGIKRVYHLSSPVVYRGRLFLNYQASELNGNKEADMALAWSATPGAGNYNDFILSSLSAVDPANHYITEDFGSQVSLAAITAVTPGFLIPPVTPSDASVICDGSSVTLSTVAAKAWQWYRDGEPMPNSNKQDLVVTQSGSYTVQTTFQNGISCISDAVPVTVNPAIEGVISADKETSISLGTVVSLTASGGTSYQWETAAGIVSGQNTATLTVRPPQTTTYKVIISNESGCNTVKTMEIAVNNDYKTLEPNNMVTPNGDGVNDVWVVKNIDMYPNNEVKIFDRAGRVVFTQNGYNNTWDATLNGTRLPEDTYYYILVLDSGKGKLTGFISVVRE